MNTTVKYGLLTAAAVIVLHLVLFFAGISETPAGEAIEWLNYVIYGGAIFMGLKEKRRKQNGYLTFGSAFGTGFMIIILAAVLIFAYRYTYYKTINPAVSNEMRMKVEEEMEEKMNSENTSEAQVEKAKQISQIIVTPMGFAMTRFAGMLITGLILSLIAAAIMKQETPTFAQENPEQQPDDTFDPYK